MRKSIEEFRLYEMNKLVVAICVFFVAVCVVEARKCENVFSGSTCDEQCCGKVDHMSCADSCKGYACSSDDDCGKSCCENRKCGTPNSACDKRKTKYEILVTVISLTVITAIIVAGVVLYFCCCRRKTPAPDMVMIVNTGVNEY